MSGFACFSFPSVLIWARRFWQMAFWVLFSFDKNKPAKSLERGLVGSTMILAEWLYVIYEQEVTPGRRPCLIEKVSCTFRFDYAVSFSPLPHCNTRWGDRSALAFCRRCRTGLSPRLFC